ncbi:MAG: DUF2064 domain-containing protein [Candidatus Heimdallarchaeota archaeon]|nr:DUF2064 domain-containing protein [Candidatus Heimdallarchaeota archaeon]
MNPSYSAVLIFTKLPQLDNVKTRLGSSVLQPNDILELHTAFIKDSIVQACKSIANEVILSIAGADSFSPLEFLGYLQNNISNEYHRQRDGSFGNRMKDAILWCFEKPITKLIILGSDSPHIQANVINDALHKLEDHDIVLGPSAGGGIYLIGMNSTIDLDDFELVFDNVELISISEFVHQKLMNGFLLPELTDIDIEEDLIGLMAIIESARLINDSHYSIPEFTQNTIQELQLTIVSDSNNNRKKRISKV